MNDAPAGKSWQRLRLMGGAFATALIAGELWRSWGVGRPLPLILDDVTMGGFLLVSSWMACSPATRARALLSAAWGMLAGMLYLSFFGKVYAPEAVDTGNWSMGALTALVGVAWIISLLGLAASLAIRGGGELKSGV